MNNGKICVSVCAATADQMIADIKRAEELADVIEVRFDCLQMGIEGLVKDLPETEKTYLFTFRPREQGGKRDLTISQRLKFWELIFYHHKSNFMIDIEAETQMMLAMEPNEVRRIVSLHDFDGVLKDFAISFDVLSDLGGPITKLAFFANDITDGIDVWKLLDRARAAKKEIIPIAMGEAGKWTRILGLPHGAFLTYGSLERGKETADGQITAKDLIDVYRVKELDLDTKVFGIVGDPVSSSLSPYMQNPAFVAGGVNAVFIPLLVKDLDDFIRRMVRPETREVELNFGGFSVTMPHKRAIMKHLDEIDPTAERIGAVNTVKADGGKLIGYNTDAHGFITPLKERFGDLKEAKVCVGGAGGGARACVYALKQEGANVTVYARDQKKAQAFADEFGVAVGISEGSFKPGAIDILVNATPLGMRGGEEEATIATADQLKGIKLVYDLVYNPLETRLIREATAAGVPAIGGLEMLVAQGALQFKIWTGREAPVEIMKTSVLKRINDGS